jgi:hypothetical protein
MWEIVSELGGSCRIAMIANERYVGDAVIEVIAADIPRH